MMSTNHMPPTPPPNIDFIQPQYIHCQKTRDRESTITSNQNALRGISNNLFNIKQHV